MRRTFSYLLLLGLSASGWTLGSLPSASAAEAKSPAYLAPPPADDGSRSMEEGDDETFESEGVVAPAAYRKVQPAQGGGTANGNAAAPSAQSAPSIADEYFEESYDEGGVGYVSGGGSTYVPTRLWLEADYLMWWLEGFNTPALVTTSPLNGNGALDSPNSTVVYGDERLAGGPRSGGRYRGLFWFDDCQTCGIGGDFFFLENKGQTACFDTDGGTIVWRPFVNTDPQVNADDAQAADEICVRSRSRIYGGSLFLRKNLCLTCCNPCNPVARRFDVIGGYRYLGLDESLRINEQATFGPVLFNLNDRFSTQNDFHGAEIGMIGELENGPWVFTGSVRTALGAVNQLVTIAGNNSQIPLAPVPDPTPGGLFAQQTNIGKTHTTDFAVLTELFVSGGYQWTSRLRTTVGYTFIYLSNVARPGDQIDPKVDGRFLDPNQGVPFNPPAIHPERRLATTDIWLQGINFGLEFDF